MVNYGKLIKESLDEDNARGLNYTNDWFHGGIKYDFNKHVNIEKMSELNLLEIGAFEGKSTVWLIDTYLNHINSSIVVVDPFFITDTTTPVKESTFDLFTKNINKSNHSSKVKFYKELSETTLPILLCEKKKFDLIFIDGSHLKKDIILDLIMSWKMLNLGGYLVMDDYTNEGGEVKSCLDFWLSSLESNEWKILHNRYQVVVHKLNV
jgi:hypothetical protein